ncbi:MAG TPA: hypothetical protein V6D47_01475 [Oscillatoriaceae cyanobacterium]
MQTIRALGLGLTVVVLAGCGANVPQSALTAPASFAAYARTKGPDVSAPVKTVLQEQGKALFGAASSVSVADYASHHTADAAKVFQAQCDTNHDGRVEAAEYQQAIAKSTVVAAYATFLQAQLTHQVAPYAGDKNFQLSELRPYMVDIGVQGDWPLIMKLTKALDLNHNGKLMDTTAEQGAFLTTFARQQLEHSLGLPITQF